MLLLTGPPGCGKTATLQALAGDMGFSVLEWVNPITNTGGPTNEGRGNINEISQYYRGMRNGPHNSNNYNNNNWGE